MLSFETKWDEGKNKLKEILKLHKNNVALAYSGGKDSSVLLEMVKQLEVELGIKILVVASDTGIEFPSIAKRMYEHADVVVKPKKAFGVIVQQYGKPWKNKDYDQKLTHLIKNIDKDTRWKTRMYQGKSKQFAPKQEHIDYCVDNGIKISNKCCEYLKKKPMRDWQKENNIECVILGTRMAEGGGRTKALAKGCYYNNNNNGMILAPLRTFSNSDMEQAIEKFNIDIDPIYKVLAKYTRIQNQRTGCFLCPYGKFRKDKSWYMSFLAEYDPKLLRAFKVFNKERLEIDNIDLSQQLKLDI